MDPTLFDMAEASQEKIGLLDDGLRKHGMAVRDAFSSIADNTNGIVTYNYCIDEGLGSSEHGFFYSKRSR